MKIRLHILMFCLLFASLGGNRLALAQVLPTMPFTITPDTISEEAGYSTATATITLGAALDQDLVVTIDNSDPQRVQVPATVTIPAKSLTASFQVQAIDNSVVDGNELVRIGISAPGFYSNAATIGLLDDESYLNLNVSPSTFSEGAGPKAAVGTLTRNPAKATDAAIVTLKSSDTTELTVPDTVIFPAGQTSVTFPIAAVDDDIIDGTQDVTITAEADTYSGIVLTVHVTDDETDLGLTISRQTFSETAGTRAAVATITRKQAAAKDPLAVTVVSSNTGKASVPSLVTIPAGATSVSFPLAAVDDARAQGPQQVTLTVSATGYTPSSAAVTVTDDEVPTLSLALRSTAISEGAGAHAAIGTVSRNTPVSQPQSVTLTSSNPGRAQVPATVTIPRGAVSVNFAISAVDNTVVDGSQNVTITAKETGFVSSSATLLVTDNDGPTLGLRLTSATIPESLANNALSTVQAVVNRRVATDTPLVVELSSSDESTATVPLSVTIPAGASSATFTITAVDNTIANDLRSATITASASGFNPGEATLNVADDEADVPALSLNVSRLVINEGDGAFAATGIISRNVATNSDLIVTLTTDPAGQVGVPISVVIPFGRTTATFPISAIDNTVLDGARDVTITAAVAGFTPSTVKIKVLDNEPSLSLFVTTDTFREDAGPRAALGIVYRNTPPTTDMVVTLASSDTTEATVPATVTIPRGATSVSFPISAVDDLEVDGAQTVTITASTPNLASAAIDVKVLDNESRVIVSVSPSTFRENASNGVATGTVRRTTPNNVPLTVNLSSSNTKKVQVPATVIIPIGADAASFAVNAVDNNLVDGNQNVTISAIAEDLVPDQMVVTVVDDDVPTLRLTLSSTAISEGIAGSTIQVGVTRNTPTGQPLTIALSSNAPTRLSLPATVTIPAQKTTATFTVQAIDDTIAEGTQRVTITARALGFVNGTGLIAVKDDDTLTLTVTVKPGTFSESAGSNAATGTVTRNTLTDTLLVVSLVSKDTSEARVPASVTIPVGATSATFPIAAVDDKVVDGSQSATLEASAPGFIKGTATVTVTDNGTTAPVVAGITGTSPNTSMVKLSTASAQASTGIIELRFTGALDSETASDATTYIVTLNGHSVVVESAAYSATTHTVKLALANSSLRPGDRLNITWHNLKDAAGHTLSSQAVGVVVR